MSESEKKEILEYYLKCSRAYRKHAKLRDVNMMNLNRGAMHSILEVLKILDVKVEGINC